MHAGQLWGYMSRGVDKNIGFGVNVLTGFKVDLVFN